MNRHLRASMEEAGILIGRDVKVPGYSAEDYSEVCEKLDNTIDAQETLSTAIECLQDIEASLEGVALSENMLPLLNVAIVNGLRTVYGDMTSQIVAMESHSDEDIRAYLKSNIEKLSVAQEGFFESFWQDIRDMFGANEKLNEEQIEKLTELYAEFEGKGEEISGKLFQDLAFEGKGDPAAAIAGLKDLVDIQTKVSKELLPKVEEFVKARMKLVHEYFSLFEAAKGEVIRFAMMAFRRLVILSDAAGVIDAEELYAEAHLSDDAKKAIRALTNQFAKQNSEFRQNLIDIFGGRRHIFIGGKELKVSDDKRIGFSMRVFDNSKKTNVPAKVTGFTKAQVADVLSMVKKTSLVYKTNRSTSREFWCLHESTLNELKREKSPIGIAYVQNQQSLWVDEILTVIQYPLTDLSRLNVKVVNRIIAAIKASQ